MSKDIEKLNDEASNSERELRKTMIISTIVCLIPVIAGIILYNQLPDTIATHWDANGNPNGWQSKFVGAIVFPGVLVIVNMLVPFIMKMDPKYTHMNDKVKALIQWIIPAVCIFCSATTLAEGLGLDSKIQVMAPLFMGLLFIILGNFLPKMKQTYTVGIKLPWTYASEENWNRTHRIAGFVWVVCGVIVMISAFLPGTVYIFTAMMIIMVAVPVIYSYGLYKKGV